MAACVFGNLEGGGRGRQQLVLHQMRGAQEPEGFFLGQNYPNPFNPSTAIRFSLPVTEKVTLTVYDILGQRVATLIDGTQFSSGQHSINFDASRLASGVYTYRLQAGSRFVESRRMLLVK